MSEGEVERLEREVEALRALVRALSARQAELVALLPVETALALARDGRVQPPATLTLENWTESAETAHSDAVSELGLLWRRIPPPEEP